MSGGPAVVDRMDRFYRGVRAVARFWLWFLFKSVDVRHPERVPAGGPILLCANHPNNFIDSLLVAAPSGARSTTWPPRRCSATG